MIRFEGPFVQQLLSQPESGMGYQRVEVTETDGRRQRGVALNAELFVSDGEPRADLRILSYERAVNSARSSASTVRSVVVLRESAARPAAVREVAQQARQGAEAKDAPVEQTRPGEVFKRFSAYANDRRVQSDGSLLAGTYATTEEDARNVKTGSDAVRRYALPNPAPASFVFTTRPPDKTDVQRGTVAPANGQPGGGVEVIFPTGTPKGTTTGPTKIPD
jgi:hypothetical protein